MATQRPSGPTHWTCEALGCAADLTDAASLRAALTAAARAAGATVVGEVEHAYHGGGEGLTVVALCAESHLLMSTWPESDYALIEVFLCGRDADASVAAEAMRRALAPQEWKTHCAPVQTPALERPAGIPDAPR